MTINLYFKNSEPVKELHFPRIKSFYIDLDGKQVCCTGTYETKYVSDCLRYSFDNIYYDGVSANNTYTYETRIYIKEIIWEDDDKIDGDKLFIYNYSIFDNGINNLD